MNDIESRFKTVLLNLFNSHKLNKLPEELGGKPIFSDPIYGSSSGDDPIFLRFKDVVGPEHFTPFEMWNVNGLNEDVKNLRIISIIFPYSSFIREASIDAVEIPSDIYCIGRNQADRFMKAIVKEIEDFFTDHGFLAISGMFSRFYSVKTGRKIYSNWSERHVAFAAGLGTFSLHEGLITDVGCNVRITSIITNAPIKVTLRNNDDPYGNCLFFSSGTCKKCVERCPGNALSDDGHDKFKCAEYGRFVREKVIQRLKKYVEPKWTRFNGTLRKRQPPVGCAFCQFNVPCMDKNPVLYGQM